MSSVRASFSAVSALSMSPAVMIRNRSVFEYKSSEGRPGTTSALRQAQGTKKWLGERRREIAGGRSARDVRMW